MKSGKRTDLFEELVQGADADLLRELIHRISSARPEVRRECFSFLKERVSLTSGEGESTEAEALMSLWYEAEPDLSELDEYGGGDYDLVDHVGELLYDLARGLEQKKIPREYRRELLDEVIPYIRSGNAGMDDELYDVAYAACGDSEDLRDLAKRFEAIGRDWPIDHARRIYRKIGDHQKYLELRSHRMKYGADYHDLATFYWETGERNKAIEVARKGLKEAEPVYISGLGDLNGSFDRKVYARKAKVMAKVRRVWVDLLEQPEKWQEFGHRVKHVNLRRPAFQEEFAKALPDWKTL